MATDLDEHVNELRHRPLGDAGPFTFVAADVLTMKVREGGRDVNAVVRRPRRPRPHRGSPGHFRRRQRTDPVRPAPGLHRRQNACRARTPRRRLSRHPRLHQLPRQPLGTDLVKQSEQAPEPRDPPPHRQPRDLPQPRRDHSSRRRRPRRTDRRTGPRTPRPPTRHPRQLPPVPPSNSAPNPPNRMTLQHHHQGLNHQQVVEQLGMPAVANKWARPHPRRRAHPVSLRWLSSS